MDQKLVKRYFCCGREQTGIVDELAYLLNHQMRLYYLERRTSGGDDGDMCKETAILTHYRDSRGEGVQTYVVTDDSVNGFMVTISVLCSRATSKTIDEVIAHLDEHDFVSSHASFKSRPMGFHSFGGFLEEWYEANDKGPFKQA